MLGMITFKEYQERTSTTAVYKENIRLLFGPNGTDWDYERRIEKLLNLSYVGLGLGEVGELQGKIKKLIRDSGGVITPELIKPISKELGDVLWYVSEMATQLGLQLDEIAEENLSKLKSRKERGVLEGSGDDR